MENIGKTTRNYRNRRRKQRQKITHIVTFLAWLLTIVVVWRCTCVMNGDSKVKVASTQAQVSKELQKRAHETDNVQEAMEQLVTGQAADVSADEPNVTLQEQAEAKRIYEANPELLVLVNKEYELSQDYDAKLRKICNRRLQASDRLYADLTNMLHDGGEAGFTYWVASAYRSRQRQQTLINEDVRKLVAQGMSQEDALAKTLEETMPAGHSEHETGLALDILCSDNMKMDVTQEQCKGNEWLRQHCAEYGFILRYPKEAVAKTKISYEPWHFRYVGVEAAQFITSHNLTLEEFWALATGTE